MQTITTFLTFNDQAAEAAQLYTSLFENSKITNLMYYPEGGPAPKGSVLSATFVLQGREYIAMNGGPHFQFTPGISLFVHCDTQAEVDTLWEKLTEGGREDQCGWLQDRFGVSWQIVPSVLGKLLQGKDPEKSKRVMQAMMQMKKLDISVLEQAAAAETSVA